jgi:mannose-1-phosphate guanylyltransferase
MKAVILAAGKGTRLRPYSDILPKPLMPVETAADGSFRTIIEKLINQISRAEISEIVIAVNYKASMIMEYLQDGRDFGVKLSYVFQGTLDGNAGAYYRAQHLVTGYEVLITDCDNYINDDSLFVNMRASHAHTVGVCRVKNIKKFAIIKTDSSGKPVDIFEKPTDEAEWGNLAKSGMMMLSPGLAAKEPSISLTHNGEYTTTEIIRHAMASGMKTELFDIAHGFNDIGTWEEYLPIFKRNLP